MIWSMKAGIDFSKAGIDFRYADASAMLPTDANDESQECPACGVCPKIPPNQTALEWDEGSSEIGDFVFTGAELVARESVADELMGQFSGLAKRPVVYIDHPSFHRPKRLTKRSKIRVWLPYEGPPLCALEFVPRIELHPNSTVSVDKSCSTCGFRQYKDFVGLERVAGPKHTLREPGKGFFFRPRDLEGIDFFTPKHTGYRLCTQTAKDYIIGRGFTNVYFLEVGETIDD